MLFTLAMTDSKMTERKIFSCTPEMAQWIKGVADKHLLRSDAKVIRAAIEMAMEQQEEIEKRIAREK